MVGLQSQAYENAGIILLGEWHEHKISRRCTKLESILRATLSCSPCRNSFRIFIESDPGSIPFEEPTFSAFTFQGSADDAVGFAKHAGTYFINTHETRERCHRSVIQEIDLLGRIRGYSRNMVVDVKFFDVIAEQLGHFFGIPEHVYTAPPRSTIQQCIAALKDGCGFTIRHVTDNVFLQTVALAILEDDIDYSQDDNYIVMTTISVLQDLLAVLTMQEYILRNPNSVAILHGGEAHVRRLQRLIPALGWEIKHSIKGDCETNSLVM